MNLKRLFYVGVLLFSLAIYLAQTLSFPPYLAFAFFVCGATLTLAGLFAAVAARVLCGAGFIIFFFASGLLVGMNVNTPAPDSVFYLAGRSGVITGSVLPSTWRVRGAGYSGFLLKTTSFHAQGETRASSGILRITLRRAPDRAKIKAGSVVSIGGEIKPLTGFSNPGGVDMAAYDHRRDVYGSLSANYEDIVLGENRENSLPALAEEWTDGLRETAGRVLPPKDKAIVFGMLFGGQEGIDSEIIRDFSTTGLIHILSVSGAHVAMIAGFAGWVSRKCRVSRSKAAPLVIAAIWFYALLSSFSIPVIRSAAMGTAVLAGSLFGRKADSGVILAFVLMLSLFYDPRWLFSISLQLSFLAAAGIIHIYPRLKAHLAALPEIVAAGLSLTLSVQIAALPFLANYFYQISLSAFLANILILPLLESCLLITFFALPFFYVLPPLGSLFFIAAGLVLGIALRLTSFFAAFPFAALPLPYLPAWLWACYYFLLLPVFDWLPGGFTRRGRLAIVCGGALCFVTAGFLWRGGGRFMVHFMDVGQGDAALIITPERQAVLIDAGGRGFSGGYDAGERVVLPYLKYYGIKELRLLILSHGHNDHAGGAAAVAKNMPVREIWFPAGQPADDVERLLKSSARSNKIVMSEGMADNIGGAEIKVAYAPNSLYTARKKDAETSAVIKLSYQGHSFLFTGDITASTEREIAPLIGQASVLKVAHHGSGASSDPFFIGSLNPVLSVISVGKDNSYGHPAPEAIERLSMQGGDILRTDLDGAVLAEVRNGRLSWYAYRRNPEFF